TIFIGHHFGSDVIKYGEGIFNVSMTGYRELITDPANLNQIIVTTYSVVGNYGMNSDDSEAIEPSITGLAGQAMTQIPSNFRTDESSSDYLKAYKIPGISGIDTREFIKLLREKGTLKGAIAPMDVAAETIVNRLKNKHSQKD